MGWKQSGDGKHDRVDISSSSKTIRHTKSADTRTGGTKTTSETKGGSGKNNGRTTVHGNDHVNYHGSHKK